MKIRNMKDLIPPEKVKEAEIHSAVANGLMAGAGKLLTDFIGGSSWGMDITIEAVSQLLREAKVEYFVARRIYEKPNLNPIPRPEQGQVSKKEEI